MNIPDEQALQDDGEQHDDEDGEQHGLVVEDVDGLGGGPDLGEPAELAAVLRDYADSGHVGVLCGGRASRRALRDDAKRYVSLQLRRKAKTNAK